MLTFTRFCSQTLPSVSLSPLTPQTLPSVSSHPSPLTHTKDSSELPLQLNFKISSLNSWYLSKCSPLHDFVHKVCPVFPHTFPAATLGDAILVVIIRGCPSPALSEELNTKHLTMDSESLMLFGNADSIFIFTEQGQLCAKDFNTCNSRVEDHTHKSFLID